MSEFAVNTDHNTRHQRLFTHYKSKSAKFTNSFFLIMTKKYQLLPKSTRSQRDIVDFKEELRNHLVPKKYKFLARGSRAGCILLTQIRVGRSDLNSHSFTVGKTSSPECTCHFPNESVSHFFLDCFLYIEERRTLFGTFEHFIPKFVSFSKRKKLDIILNGFDRDNPDIYSTNVKLQCATQNYVLQTKRFKNN